MLRLSQEQYEALAEAFMRQAGPNPATGFFGSWAWHQHNLDRFHANLEAQGVDLSQIKKRSPDFRFEMR